MQNLLEDFYGELDEMYARGDLNAVECFLIKYEETIREEAIQNDSQEQTELLLAVYNEMGTFYNAVGRHLKAIEVYEHAGNKAKQTFGEDSSQYASILNNMAGVYRTQGELQKAIDLFKEAAAIYGKLGMEDAYPYAGVMNNLALCCQEKGNYPCSIEYLDKALRIYERNPESKWETALSYNNMTALYSAMGDKDGANFCIRRALKAFEACEDEPNVSYCAGMNSLAGFLFTEGEFERAAAVYRKSARYTLKFFGENLEYAQTCQNIGRTYERLGRRDEAISSLERADRIYSRLLGKDHERTSSVEDDIKRIRRLKTASGM